MSEDLLPYLLPTTVFFIFCAVHSLLASHKLKSVLFEKLPALKAWYRLCYNCISVVFLVVWYLSLPADQPLYWVSGFLFFVMLFTQFIFFILFISSILSQDGFTFIGLKQIRDKLLYDSQPDYLDEPEKGKLIRSGFYRYIRHPMYTFAILMLISSPIMTANLLYATIIFGIYFWIGSWFEERNLIKRFGDEYRIYQREVPKFIPRFFS